MTHPANANFMIKVAKIIQFECNENNAKIFEQVRLDCFYRAKKFKRCDFFEHEWI
jgi:hypothetical protein